jgi:hypothetical protein
MKLSTVVCLSISVVLPCYSGSCLAQSTTESDTVRRIIAPIDESQRVTLKGNVHPLAKSQFDRGPAPVSEPTGRIQLLLRRSTAQQQALTQHLSDLQNPSSTAFHKWLTPAQYGAQYGVDVTDIQSVESWLQSHGFRIEKTPASRNVIQFSGTIDQVQNAFHTSVHAFAVHGQTRFANVTELQIPAALSEVIAGVGPLNNFHSRPGVKVSAKGIWNATTHNIQPDLTLFDRNSNPYLFVDPADAATIYDSPNGELNPSYTGTSYTGKGVTIGIVGVSNLYMQDIVNFRTGFLGESTASANLPNVIIDGNDPGIDATGAGVEALLDNEVAGGLAPGAQIAFYISAGSDLSDGLLNAIARAIDDNAVDILSISFGACESDLGSSGNQLILELAEQAAAQGISVTVSTGDNGSAGCDNFDIATAAQGGLAVNGFASTPYTIAVGGTDFDVLPSSFSTYASKTSGTPPYYRTAAQYIPEKPWNDSTTVNTTISQNSAYTSSTGQRNIVAGSGGASSIYAKPAFQTSLTPADGERDLPDVSLLAGNGFYSALWVVCSDSVADGTGAGSPSPDCTNTGGQFSNGTSFTGVGGTSASAPAFAGMLALAVQATGGRLGQADTVLYQLAKAHPSYFHDITSGDNSVPCASGSANCGSNGFLTGYDAGTGYDLATGLGSIDAAALINNWKSVSLGSTSTTLQINGSTTLYSGIHGANLTFNAGVTGSSGTPTGIVAITDNANMTTGGTASGPQNNGQVPIPLTAGSGSATYNGLPGGSYQVTARYGGDTSFAASTSVPISVSISPEPSTTTLTVNAYNPATGKTISTSSIPYGFYVFADADITGTAEGSKTQGVATGSVQFLNGATALGTSAVSSGNEASWPPLNSTFTALPAGSYTLSAQYSGDASYLPSTGTASFTIAKASTTTTAGFGGTPIEYGNQEQIAADVLTNSYGVAPTGTFQFSVDGQPVLAPQPIYESGGYNNANGNNNWAWADAQTTYTFLAVGQHTLSASYSGDGNYAASASSSVNLSVTPAPPFFTTFGWNVPSQTATMGQQTTATATLFGSEHGAAPTGTITFYDNGAAISGTVTYSGQAASGNVGSLLTGSIPFTFTSAGNHALTASYSGDTNYLTATSPGSNTVTVLGPFSASAGAITVTAPGQSGTTVLTVTPNGGFTGTVTLSCTAPVSAAETTCGFGSGSSFAPSGQLTIAGAAATINFQVTTTAQHKVASLSTWRSSGFVLAVLLVVIAPRKRYRGLCLVMLGAILVFGAASCGSGGGGGGGGGGTTDQGTLPGTYNFTVTATSGSGASAYTTSTQVSVTVQ